MRTGRKAKGTYRTVAYMEYMSKFRIDLGGLRPNGREVAGSADGSFKSISAAPGAPRPIPSLYLVLFLAIAAAAFAGSRAHAATAARAIEWRLVAQHPDLCRFKVRSDLVTIGISVTTPDENGNYALYALCSDHVTREFHNQ